MRNLIGARRILPAVLAVAALLITGFVTVALLMAQHNRSSAHQATPSPAPSTSPVPAPSGEVTLVQGNQPADGIEVGYPHTTVGAISAASEYLDAVGSTLDPDYAASIMRTAGDPASASLPANLAESTAKLRAALRLPTAGPLNPPIAFQTTAQMYQLRDETTDSALVLLLAQGTFTNARGSTAQTTGVFPIHMRWVGDDWKLAGIGGAGQDYSKLNATPDTSAAASHGWSALTSPVGGGGS